MILSDKFEGLNPATAPRVQSRKYVYLLNYNSKYKEKQIIMAIINDVTLNFDPSSVYKS
jgi:hypothetical protein